MEVILARRKTRAGAVATVVSLTAGPRPAPKVT